MLFASVSEPTDSLGKLSYKSTPTSTTTTKHYTKNVTEAAQDELSRSLGLIFSRPSPALPVCACLCMFGYVRGPDEVSLFAVSPAVE